MIPIGEGLFYDPRSGRVNNPYDRSMRIIDPYMNSGLDSMMQNLQFASNVSYNLLGSTTSLAKGSYSLNIGNMLSKLGSGSAIDKTGNYAGLGISVFASGLTADVMKGMGMDGWQAFLGSAATLGAVKGLNELFKPGLGEQKPTYWGELLDTIKKGVGTKHLGKLKLMGNMFKMNAAVEYAGAMGEAMLGFGSAKWLENTNSPSQLLSRDYVLNETRQKSTPSVTQADMINVAGMLSSFKSNIERISHPARANYYNRISR